MPDFLSYTMHRRDERVIHGDVVMLSAERWQWLVDFIAANYGDANVTPEITVYEPTEVDGIMFLPARYRGPDDAWPLTIRNRQGRRRARIKLRRGHEHFVLGYFSGLVRDRT